MAKNSIPDDVKAKVKAIIEKFNLKESRYPDTTSLLLASEERE